MSRQGNEWRNVLLCCMIWAMFGVVNLTFAYNAPAPTVYWESKRLPIAVGQDLTVDVASFCRGLALDYTIDGHQLVIGGEKPLVIGLDELLGRSQALVSAASAVPLEGLCQALGIAYRFDEASKMVMLGESSDYAQGVPVLLYHHILPQAEIKGIFADNELVVSVEDFQAQMDYLRDNGYQTVSLSRLERYVNGEELLPEKSVVITFDDGYLSNYRYAYPILKAHGFTAILFALTGSLEGEAQTFDPARLQYLSWSDLHAMKDVFTLGSHTDNLHRLNDSGRSAFSEASADQMISDLSASRRRLNHTPYFAYPYGHFGTLAQDTLSRHGIKLAFTTEEGLVKIGDNPLALNRFDMGYCTSLAKLQRILQTK